MIIWELANYPEYGMNEFFPTKKKAQEVKRREGLDDESEITKVEIPCTREGMCYLANQRVRR